jgi:small redox-active disulfide protein 2
MKFKVLGTGCKKCTTLYNNVQSVIESEGLEATLEKVEALEEILKYNVMITPALVIDDKVVSKGKVLKAKDILKLI